MSNRTFNLLSARDYGWDPGYLNLPPDEWGQTLVDAIHERQEFYGLPSTGIVDEMLARRLQLERDLMADTAPTPDPPVVQDALLVAGELLPCRGARCVTPGEPGSYEIQRYYEAANGRTRSRFADRSIHVKDVRRAVLHWTVTKNVHDTWRFAWSKKRSVSTHLEVDWDGTIYQLVDLQHEAYHCGVGWLNDRSVGVDLVNPVGQKTVDSTNAELVRHGQVERPVCEGWEINTWDPGPFLGPTDAQLQALDAIADFLEEHIGIPREAAFDDGRDLQSRDTKGWRAERGEKVIPHGWMQHAQVKKGKWDHAGIDLAEFIGRAAA